MDETTDIATILVVNDEPDQLSLLRVVLKTGGYRALTARDGHEGFEVLLRERVDLLVSDVMMPEVDGIELCRRVRAHPQLKGLPILLVSALRKDTESVVEGLRAGADAYIEHPFDTMRLVAEVARLLERKRTEDRIRELNEALEVKVRKRTAQLEEANAELEREIAERRAIEAELEGARDAALEAARIKSQFLANVSHEIRTPMHAVIGMTDLLLNSPLKPRQREYTELIRDGAASLLKVINDVLDFSKIEAGKLRLDRDDFDLADVVEGALQMFAERAQAKGITLHSSIAPTVPTALRGDPGRLRQVLTNLISNAVKFTDAGGVTVRVKSGTDAGSYIGLRFEVRDTGIGVRPEARRRIFLPFAQADGSDARIYGGTGLGLAISRQLVELMGGEIGVTSEVGQGSCFWFTVRLAKQPPAALAGRPSSLEGLGLLLVTDDARKQESLLDQARRWDMRVAAAAGSRSLGLLRQARQDGEPFTYALLELDLTDADALALAQHIRADTHLRDMRLVLLTSAVIEPEIEAECEKLFDASVIIPTRRQHLHDCLLSLLHRGRRSEPAAEGEDAAEGAPVAPPEPRAPAAKTVLVAEDNAVNQSLVVFMLEELGYAAVIAPDGRQAVEEFARGDYVMVLMDCQMPLMDGYAAVSEIRRREGGARHTPVIALTADAMPGTRERCLAAGMDDYISKPFTTRDLGSVLAKWSSGAPDAAPSPEHGPSEGADDDGDDSAVSLDMKLIKRLRVLDTGAEDVRVLQLVDTFLQDMKARREALWAAFDQRLTERMQREAHALKGSAGLFGARRLSRTCAEIIVQAGRGDLVAARRALTELDQEALEIDRGLTRWRGSA